MERMGCTERDYRVNSGIGAHHALRCAADIILMITSPRIPLAGRLSAAPPHQNIAQSIEREKIS